MHRAFSRSSLSAIAHWNEGVRTAYCAGAICALLRCNSNAKAEEAICTAISSGHDIIKGLAQLQKQAVASAEGDQTAKTAFVKSLCESVVKMCQDVNSVKAVNE